MQNPRCLRRFPHIGYAAWLRKRIWLLGQIVTFRWLRPGGSSEILAIGGATLPLRRRQSKLLGSQSQSRTGCSFGFVIFVEGECEDAPIMKLLPVDFTGLQKLAHLLTGAMKPCL